MGKAKVRGKSQQTNLCVVLEFGNVKNPQIVRAGAVFYTSIEVTISVARFLCSSEKE